MSENDLMTRFKRWIELSEKWSEAYSTPTKIRELSELKELDKEFLPIDKRWIVVNAYDQIKTKFDIAIEALELISMRKEGFEEDNYQCIEMADEALEKIRSIKSGPEV